MHPAHHKIFFTGMAIVLLLTFLSGCASAKPASPISSVAPDATPDATPGASLAAEIHAELKAMTSSTYQHDTYVYRAAGIFDYDCSGLMDYAIGIVRPEALSVLGVGRRGRPLARDFVHYLANVGAGAPSATWSAVPTVGALKPGDVISWLATAASKTKNTGHVLIVMGSPYLNPQNSAEWLIPIADSTATGHSMDSRNAPNALSRTGLGTGTIGLGVDQSGHPIGFYWKGLTSSLVTTTVALGALR